MTDAIEEISLAVRQKSYEDNTRFPRGTVAIRVDGRGFHSWTKQVKAKRPFDLAIHAAMSATASWLGEEMQGFRCAYTQSDEATFILNTVGEKEEGWFGYKRSKLESITASMFTDSFNFLFAMLNGMAKNLEPAFFDARAFAIPSDDAANNIVWRMQDWERNSVAMLGRSMFSHNELLGKNVNEVKLMCAANGQLWDNLEPWQKYGTFVADKGQTIINSPMNYSMIDCYIRPVVDVDPLGRI